MAVGADVGREVGAAVGAEVGGAPVTSVKLMVVRVVLQFVPERQGAVPFLTSAMRVTCNPAHPPPH